MTFDTFREAWELDWLTNDPDSTLERFFGADSWRELASEDTGAEFRWELQSDRLEYRLVREGAETTEIGVFERR